MFAEVGTDQLLTEVLLVGLKARDCNHNEKSLANALKPLDIQPTPLRQDGGQRRGYRQEWFQTVWSRYVPD